MTKEKTFETSLLSLEEIIRELEKGEVPLDDMIKKYEEARVSYYIEWDE